uniref:Uncharacterized protein n=1 Tax=Oryza rufipogon TaxID=4529 RepID=A0A0E0PVF7_ORYRU
MPLMVTEEGEGKVATFELQLGIASTRAAGIPDWELMKAITADPSNADLQVGTKPSMSKEHAMRFPLLLSKDLVNAVLTAILGIAALWFFSRRFAKETNMEGRREGGVANINHIPFVVLALTKGLGWFEELVEQVNRTDELLVELMLGNTCWCIELSKIRSATNGKMVLNEVQTEVYYDKNGITSVMASEYRRADSSTETDANDKKCYSL